MFQQRKHDAMNAEKVARGLGWFSIGLGLAEALTPRNLTESLGMTGSETLVRAYGLREITAGVGILASPRPTAPWLWARVGGDALDIATLTAAALNPENPQKRAVGFALANVAAITALDVLCALQLGEKEPE